MPSGTGAGTAYVARRAPSERWLGRYRPDHIAVGSLANDIVQACRDTGAEAVHPGYGFLSENKAFAKALEEAGIAFIGPPVGAIQAMGDKIESKKLAEKAGVKVFTFNTEVPTEARETLGLPRETLQNWIGHLVPDNVASGRQMAAMLTEQAAQMGLTEGDAPPPIIALSGTLDSSAAKDRNLGLMQAAQDHQIDLRQLIYANWSRDLAEEKTRVLMKRYPDIVAVWSASDGMAAGAIAAAKQAGRVPGKDVLIGGFDWEPEAGSPSGYPQWRAGGELWSAFHGWRTGTDAFTRIPRWHGFHPGDASSHPQVRV